MELDAPDLTSPKSQRSLDSPVSRVSTAKFSEDGRPQSTKSGGRSPSRQQPDVIHVNVKRIDGKDKLTMQIRANKKITIANIKDRVSEEWGLRPHEQVIIFRGQRVSGDDRAMPLNTPDLAEVVKEAGENGLQMAVMNMPKQLPRFLRREGLEDVNDRRSSQATALHRATRRSELTVMEELLENPEFTEADAVDNAGQTALHAAVLTWNRPACEILLKKSNFAKVAHKDEEGRTALHIAASWGDEKVVRWLVEHIGFSRTEVEAEDGFGRTALQYAMDCGHAKAAEIIQWGPEGRPVSAMSTNSRSSRGGLRRPTSSASPTKRLEVRPQSAVSNLSPGGSRASSKG